MSDICPACGHTSVDGRIAFDWHDVVVDETDTMRLHVCRGCGVVFTDLEKATATAIRLQREREEEIEQAIENTLRSQWLRYGTEEK